MYKLDAPIFGLSILTPAVADGDSKATATLSAKMRNATATTYYQPIGLHLIILILKLSECPTCPSLVLAPGFARL
jgi:hypothetical protein